MVSTPASHNWLWKVGSNAPLRRKTIRFSAETVGLHKLFWFGHCHCLSCCRQCCGCCCILHTRRKGIAACFLELPSRLRNSRQRFDFPASSCHRRSMAVVVSSRVLLMIRLG